MICFQSPQTKEVLTVDQNTKLDWVYLNRLLEIIHSVSVKHTDVGIIKSCKLIYDLRVEFALY